MIKNNLTDVHVRTTTRYLLPILYYSVGHVEHKFLRPII